MSAPNTPPPYLRATVTDDERQQIEQAIGPVGDDRWLRAVRDGRGRDFQRLEFLGDSVLDVVLAVHRWVEPNCPRCRGRETAPEASDRHLASVAVAAGLGSWLEWRASEERLADLVETCVAACWLSGSWSQTVPFISELVHPIAEGTLQALTSGVAAQPGRAARRVGSAILELAAGGAVFGSMPDADEGVLSTARATLHRASAVAAVARRGATELELADTTGDDDLVLSRVEDALASVISAEGADAGLAAAAEFVSATSG